MAAELSAEGKKIWNQIVAKAWADPAFKKRLLSDPAAVLKEHGIQSMGATQIKVVENTDQAVYLVLPSQQYEELSEADLERVAAGRALMYACITDKRMTR